MPRQFQVLPGYDPYGGLFKGIGTLLEGLGGLGGKIYEHRQIKKHQKMMQEQAESQKQALRDMGVPDEVIESGDPNIIRNYIKQQQTQQMNMQLGQSLSPSLAGQQPVPQEQGMPVPGSPAQPDLGSLFGALGPQGAMRFLDITKRQEQADRKEAQRASEFQQKMASDDKKFAYKETKSFRDEVLAGKRSADEQIATLERMKELHKSGKLGRTPEIFGSVLKKIGIKPDIFRNPESAEFQKLRNTFMRDMKSIFGGKVSNLEMEAFLEGIPSLIMNPKARERIIDTLITYNNAKQDRYKVMNNIIKKNEGNPSLDLSRRVEDKLTKKMDKRNDRIIKKIKNNFELIDQISKKETASRELSPYDRQAQIREFEGNAYSLSSDTDKRPDPSEGEEGDLLVSPNGIEFKKQGGKWVRLG